MSHLRKSIVLLLGLGLLLPNVIQAQAVESVLEMALRNSQVGRVRLLLHNQPNLKARLGRNNGSFLWMALFGSVEDPGFESVPFTSEQKEMTKLLLRAEPELMNRGVGLGNDAPLAALFSYYRQLCLKKGCQAASGAEERIAFLLENGASFKTGEFLDLETKRGVVGELPLLLARQPTSILEFALSHGLNVHHMYRMIRESGDEVQMSMLGFVTANALFEVDEEKSKEAVENLKVLLRFGANPRAPFYLPGPKEGSSPVFHFLLRAWAAYASDANSPAGRSLRFTQVFQLFLENGLSLFEPYKSLSEKEDTTSALEWLRRYHPQFEKIEKLLQGAPSKDLFECQRHLTSV